MLLNFEETEELISKYDIPLTQTEEVSSVEEVLDFADQNDFPLVLKVFSPQVLHRTERDLVRKNIENEKELEKAFADLKEKVEEIGDGRILIQEHLNGVELIYGMKKDETFGPVLMFGLGGIFVEVLKDVSFGITPLNQKEAREMIQGIKGVKILKGFRNYPAVNLETAADFLMKLSDLAEQEEIKEIDLNPVFAQGKNFKIADPKIIV